MGVPHDHLADGLNWNAGSGGKGHRVSLQVMGKTNTTFKAVACALTLKRKN